MYIYLLSIHSVVRWLVLAALLYSVYRAWRGYRGGLTFSAADNSLRHWTATLAHIQLLIGFTLYFSSPLVQYFLSDTKNAVKQPELLFFGILHIGLMFVSVLVLTIGSALAKRRESDRDKYRTMLFWFSAALFVIFMAIPWPFSPLASRPWLRTFE